MLNSSYNLPACWVCASILRIIAGAACATNCFGVALVTLNVLLKLLLLVTFELLAVLLLLITLACAGISGTSAFTLTSSILIKAGEFTLSCLTWLAPVLLAICSCVLAVCLIALSFSLSLKSKSLAFVLSAICLCAVVVCLIAFSFSSSPKPKKFLTPPHALLAKSLKQLI